MGKVSPVSTKYVIDAEIHIEGVVEKPDVIGAIFGQTEGFLGQDLELRELQRSGKVGRIEVNLDVSNGKSAGHIIIPCSLDKAETAIIGASLETIERIGPCNAKVKILKIQDLRVSKRNFVITRAKELLNELQSSVLPDSQEITNEVMQAVRMSEIGEWGIDKFPAGPDVDTSDEIFVVEGRADVLNLLKNGFKNVVGLNGTNIPESIKDLCRQKTVTAFVDGDRGGDVILKSLLDSTEIDYITKAAPGKEVEELTKKEIHIALRARVAAEQFRFDVDGSRRPQQIRANNMRRPLEDREYKQQDRQDTREYRPQEGNRDNRQYRPSQTKTEVDPKNKASFKNLLDDLVGTRGAYIIDKDFNILGKVPTMELEATLKGISGAFAVIFDGSVTREIVKAAETSNVGFVVGTNSNVNNNDSKTVVLTAREL